MALEFKVKLVIRSKEKRSKYFHDQSAKPMVAWLEMKGGEEGSVENKSSAFSHTSYLMYI